MIKGLKKLKKGLIITGSVFILITLISILNYLGINFNISRFVVLLGIALLFFVSGFINGQKRDNKGYIAGFKIGLIIIAIFIILNLIIFRSPFSLKRNVYYIILLLCSVLGSIIGINKKAMN